MRRKVKNTKVQEIGENIINLSNMNTSIKILNEEDFEDKLNTAYTNLNEVYNGIMSLPNIQNPETMSNDLKVNGGKILKKYDELLNKYVSSQDKKQKEKALPTADEISDIRKELDDLKNGIIRENQAEDLANPYNVNRFICRRCGYAMTANLIGAPDKCPDCKSKDFWERAVTCTKKGKIEYKDWNWVKFNPDTNMRNKALSHKNEIPTQEKISSLIRDIELKMPKLQEEIKLKSKIEENKMEKEYTIKCTNPSCGFSYSTNDDPESDIHRWCNVCQKANSFSEAEQEVEKD